MKRKLTATIIAVTVCAMMACSNGSGEKIQSDKKPETSGTTVEDAIGEDSEIQMTTPKPSESESEEPTTSNTDKETSKDTGNTDNSTSQSTTVKPDNGTTTQQTTTKKPEQTTTKKPEQTTTKKPEQTTTKKPEQTTTNKQEQTTTKKEDISTEKQTTTNSAHTGSTRGEAINVTEFTSSTAAINKAKNVVSQIINNKMSDYECVKAIHDYLVKHVNYDYAGLTSGAVDSPSHKSHSAEGALCDNLAVCDGYAKAFELMCAQIGIEVYMMYGTAGNNEAGWESHAWNVVKVAGEWYQIDCTWDDPLINGDIITDGSNITYKYFLLTDNEMYVDHKLNAAETPHEKVCTSTLFMGLGETLSLNEAMGEPGVIVTNSASFYKAITDYTSKSQWKCYIAVPQTQSITEQGILDAILEGARTLGYNGFRYGYSFVSSNVGKYVVYELTITVTQN